MNLNTKIQIITNRLANLEKQRMKNAKNLAIIQNGICRIKNETGYLKEQTNSISCKNQEMHNRLDVLDKRISRLERIMNNNE